MPATSPRARPAATTACRSFRIGASGDRIGAPHAGDHRRLHDDLLGEGRVFGGAPHLLEPLPADLGIGLFEDALVADRRLLDGFDGRRLALAGVAGEPAPVGAAGTDSD